MSIAIYYPFFRVMDRQAYEMEQAGQLGGRIWM